MYSSIVSPCKAWRVSAESGPCEPAETLEVRAEDGWIGSEGPAGALSDGAASELPGVAGSLIDAIDIAVEDIGLLVGWVPLPDCDMMDDFGLD